jgi:hypothetical protein
MPLTQAEKQRRWRDRQLLAGADLNAERRQIRAEKAAVKATTTDAARADAKATTKAAAKATAKATTKDTPRVCPGIG